MAKKYRYLGIGIMIVALLSGVISVINGLNPTTLGYTSFSLEHSFIYSLIGFMISNIDSSFPYKQDTIKDDRLCNICKKKLTEHSSFSDNHTYIPDKEQNKNE